MVFSYSFPNMPTEIQHIIFAATKLNDAVELSSTSKVARDVFCSFLRLPPNAISTVFTALKQRFYGVSPALLKDMRFLPTNASDTFENLCLQDVKNLMLKGAQIERSLSSTAQDPQILLAAAERSLKSGLTDDFIAIVQNPALKTFISTNPNQASILDHAKMLDVIVSCKDLDALKRFALLPAFSQIPADNVIIVNGNEMPITPELGGDTDVISLAIVLESAFVMSWDDKGDAYRSEFLHILLHHDQFQHIESGRLAAALMPPVANQDWNLMADIAEIALPRITQEDFIAVFDGFFEDEPFETRVAIEQEFNLFMQNNERLFREEDQ